MEICNSQIAEDIRTGKPLQLDLGSGGASKKHIYTIDHIALEGVDIVADLNKPLDLLPDNCADYIYTRHALEHIHDFLMAMQEIHRISKPGGTIEIIVPHFSNIYGYSDPTHVRFFGLYTMYYFVKKENQPESRKVPPFYTTFKFKIRSIKIQFYRNGLIDRILSPVLSRFINSNIKFQEFYERRLAMLFHAWQIVYIMEVDK
jgi:ubiquinone/menaquinone biosynthesis C-methylase UbiE